MFWEEDNKLLASSYWEMPLSELRCKWYHMPKSMVGILFTSKMRGREIRKKEKRGQELGLAPLRWSLVWNDQKGKIDMEPY